MRIANSWTMNTWRKFKIKKDTLYFITGGEFADSAHAAIDYNSKNKLMLHFYEYRDSTYILRSIEEKINYFNEDQLAKDFKRRLKNRDCK